MLFASLMLISGMALLIWSADRFVGASSSAASILGMPPLLIGMVIVGFGTSAPEMIVSALAAADGATGIALGNAYGSNITNIALILGVTALISPVLVHSRVVRKELPILAAVTGLAVWQMRDLRLSHAEAWVLLLVFSGLMGWTIYQGLKTKHDALGEEVATHFEPSNRSLKMAIIWMIGGLTVLIVSSRMLVWGAVELAKGFGVSDLIIGLTVVAVGTSLPELASSVIASRKGEHDIALGNIIGSNLFNTLAVVGIAGLFNPLQATPELLSRDLLVMSFLTITLFVVGFGFRKQGKINRFEGGFLLMCYLGYVAYLITTA